MTSRPVRDAREAVAEAKRELRRCSEMHVVKRKEWRRKLLRAEDRLRDLLSRR